MPLSRFAGMILTVIFAFAFAGDAATPSVAAEKKGGGKKGETEVATFAGGCFWCVEAALEKIDGVEEVVSGLHRRRQGRGSDLQRGLLGARPATSRRCRSTTTRRR